MKVQLEICCDNAAFTDNPTELGDILRHVGVLADSQTSLDNLRIYDCNGNRVGLVKVDSS